MANCSRPLAAVADADNEQKAETLHSDYWFREHRLLDRVDPSQYDINFHAREKWAYLGFPLGHSGWDWCRPLSVLDRRWTHTSRRPSAHGVSNVRPSPQLTSDDMGYSLRFDTCSRPSVERGIVTHTEGKPGWERALVLVLSASIRPFWAFCRTPPLSFLPSCRLVGSSWGGGRPSLKSFFVASSPPSPMGVASQPASCVKMKTSWVFFSFVMAVVVVTG